MICYYDFLNSRESAIPTEASVGMISYPQGWKMISTQHHYFSRFKQRRLACVSIHPPLISVFILFEWHRGRAPGAGPGHHGDQHGDHDDAVTAYEHALLEVALITGTRAQT